MEQSGNIEHQKQSDAPASWDALALARSRAPQPSRNQKRTKDAAFHFSLSCSPLPKKHSRSAYEAVLFETFRRHG